MGHAHHITHWADGGATSLDNLVLLCGHHHRTIHHTPWGSPRSTPAPADHYMTMLGDQDIGSGPLRFAKDDIGADYHNPSHSHIDALCHVAFDGVFYNGTSITSLTPQGATANYIGYWPTVWWGWVLLDVPGMRGERWVELGDTHLPDELEECERRQGVTVGEGEIFC